MRGYDLAALWRGRVRDHAGGTLSIMDITAALYLRVRQPRSQKIPLGPTAIASSGRTGHKAPSLYSGLAFARILSERRT